MSTVTRTWLAFAALGTGMIHLALVISSPLPIAIVLVLIGVAEIGWGVLTFVRDRIARPRLVLVAAVAPIVLWAAVVLAAAATGTAAVGADLGFSALAIAAVLELFVAGVLAVQLRRGINFAAPSRTPPAGRYLLGLVLGGLAVASLTTPALAATEAGLYAQPHGQHRDGVEPRIPSDVVLDNSGHTGH
ncbi:MAG: hypothetical protein JWQ43_1567 [Glaciihabitans sp.]|nr:hypothetical protein [Glaciihabitans sp.]